MKGLVLHSGGMDSTVCLAIAKGECEEVLSLGFEYGQRHGSREASAAADVCMYYAVERRMVELPDVFRGFGSTLVDDLPNPHMSYEEIRASVGPSPTYVPARNSNLISAATAVALVEGCEYIYFGAHADDAHNYAYPDTTPEFISAMSRVVEVGTYYKVHLKSPLMWMTKGAVVQKGEKLGVPFKLTRSCYEDSELHCGFCPTCVSRKEAFKWASVEDPTVYLE